VKAVRFHTSALTDLPTLRTPQGVLMPEIALAGRSNVGKSSLINHFLQCKGLAKVSSTPGKTQLLNFFTIEDRLALVDLPGYGFAKAPPEKIREWNRAIDRYMRERPSLALILLLLDSRRTPSDDDLALARWAQSACKPLCVVFTKTDTLPSSRVHAQTQRALELLQSASAPVVHYSIKDAGARARLIATLHELHLWD
jgi:GTP-binding protein